MSDWKVGQNVVIVSSDYREARVTDGQITKIGRKWITVKSGQWMESRFDFNGRGDQNYGHAPRLYASREVYEAEVDRRRVWNTFHSAVRRQNHPPDHLSTEQIAALLSAVTPPAGDEPEIVP